MGRIERIRVFPVKGLHGIDFDTTTVLDGGTLAHDREFALFDDGEILNGRQSPKVHDLRTSFDPVTGEFTVTRPDGEAVSVFLDDEESTVADDGDRSSDEKRARVNAWFSEFFGVDLRLRRNRTLGYVDRRRMGPSVISTATVETVASWFEELTAEGVRRRLRANVEVSGVPAFWEDRFVGEDAPAFEVDGIRFEGDTPCGRCVVPRRDPDTGEQVERFRERFVERRRESFPDWADSDAFDHFYTVMLIARVAETDRGKSIRIGDTVTVVDE